MSQFSKTIKFLFWKPPEELIIPRRVYSFQNYIMTFIVRVFKLTEINIAE